MTIHQIECFLEVAHTLNFTERPAISTFPSRG